MHKNNDDEKIINNLVEKSQKGDADSFGILYDIFADKIYKFVFYKIGNTEVEDIVSDIFLKAWRNISGFKKKVDAKFSSWLFCIARNRVIDFYRTKKENISIDNMPYLYDENERLQTELINEKLSMEHLSQALFRLKEKDREIIVLRYFEEMSYNEISKILDKKEGNIRVILSRAINKLRDAI